MYPAILLIIGIYLLKGGKAIVELAFHDLYAKNEGKIGLLFFLFMKMAGLALIIVAVVMTLDQLNFAQSIVNAAFLLILGAVAVAFAISFGIGGRSFAEKQLSKFEQKVRSEDNKNE